MRNFELPESLKESKDADAMQKVGQAIVDTIGEADKAVIVATIAEKLKEFRESGATKETVDALEKVLKAQGTAITELKERGVGVTADWRSGLKASLADKSIVGKIKNHGYHEVEIKADPTIITTAGQLVGAPHNVLTTQIPGIAAPPREVFSLLSLLSKGSTNSKMIRWINRSAPNGGAAATAENALKPAVDFSLSEETSVAKKIAAYMNITEEALEDEAYMQTVIDDVLREVTENATNAELLTGDGTGEHLTGILTGAPAYVGTSLDGTVVNASPADAIYALALQVRLAFANPDIVLINPADLAAIDLEKNSSGVRQGAEARAILASLRFVPTVLMPAGKVAVIDSSKFKVHPYKGYTVRWGWVNDDFKRNALSVVAELRLHSYHNSLDNAAIATDSIATVTGALQKADA
jgi:HK97 family phage major capsid protein